MTVRKTDTVLGRVAALHKALGDETRLRIINVLLALGELCVCDLEAGLEITQSKASRHLGVLRQAGLLTDRRDGTWIFYRLRDEQSPGEAAICHHVGATYGCSREGKRDVARTKKLRRCCS